MRDELTKLVIDTALGLGDPGIDACEDFGPSTLLFGKDGLLDSMTLVSLIIAVEQEVEDRYDKSVALADERALSQSKSPYRTVEALADYAAALLEGE